MFIEKRKNILSQLGEIFKNMSSEEGINLFSSFYDNIFYHNPWFTKEFVQFSLNQWSEQLSEENISDFLNGIIFNEIKNYELPKNINNSKKIGIICAGNIPLVGLHDVVCCYLTGYLMIVKLSSKDNILMKFVLDKLIELDTEANIFYTEERLQNFDALIATGSNNSNKYFEYYFGKNPHLFRSNKTSVAILTGEEYHEDLQNLSDDVFLYFGLGCRNVSKIFIPENYDFNLLGTAFQKYFYLADHHKYYNNLTYQYALLAMNQIVHVNFQNLLLIENSNVFSPIGVLNFEYYSDINSLNDRLSNNCDTIQCVVANNNKIKKSVCFGYSQRPKLSDFADNVDTINFLLNI
ncbi:MAG: hypothetical protein LBV69_07985 [Bacteroidales bacterium]|jgi:hypothetical protein|nr:hypothetical protein [Bacteroidales bacterium]